MLIFTNTIIERSAVGKENTLDISSVCDKLRKLFIPNKAYEYAIIFIIQ